MSEYFAENYYPRLVFTTKKFNSIWCQLLLATKLKVLGKIWDGRLLLNLLEIAHVAAVSYYKGQREGIFQNGIFFANYEILSQEESLFILTVKPAKDT